MVKSGIWNSFPYVSISLPYFSWPAASSEASADSDVEEGESWGESLGDTTALESESAVAEVTFLLRSGLLAAGRLEAVAGAMLLDLERINWSARVTSCSREDPFLAGMFGEKSSNRNLCSKCGRFRAGPSDKEGQAAI